MRAQFPNDYGGVQNSIRAGARIKAGTPLEKALAAFEPFGSDAAERPAAGHKFLEFVKVPVLNYWRRPDARSERWT